MTCWCQSGYQLILVCRHWNTEKKNHFIVYIILGRPVQYHLNGFVKRFILIMILQFVDFLMNFPYSVFDKYQIWFGNCLLYCVYPFHRKTSALLWFLALIFFRKLQKCLFFHRCFQEIQKHILLMTCLASVLLHSMEFRLAKVLKRFVIHRRLITKMTNFFLNFYCLGWYIGNSNLLLGIVEWIWWCGKFENSGTKIENYAASERAHLFR